ncbi:Uncharacterised protein [Mycobacteroides abscessus subsp. abscessus]|nr:Uncharacterised protein [Mycobacteroides abscessus subsp. abscessus]
MAAESTETREDFPAEGKPTSPTSATVFSSSVRSTSAPASPSKAKPGALRARDANAALPSPPRPPAAASKRAPAPTKSARMRPSSSSTTVPSGTLRIRSSPLAPLRWPPMPWVPLGACTCGWKWKSSKVCTCGSTSRITLPPRPPLPPSGPPRGLNFSRCTEAQP